jgi:hypothetical protein
MSEIAKDISRRPNVFRGIVIGVPIGLAMWAAAFALARWVL